MHISISPISIYFILIELSLKEKTGYIHIAFIHIIYLVGIFVMKLACY